MDDLAVQLAELDRDLAVGRLRRGDAPAKLAPFRGGAPDPERAGLAQEHLAEPVRIRGGAQDAQQHARSVLFHLDGRMKHVERARVESALHEVTQDLTAAIVQVGFEDSNGVDLPISFWRSPFGGGPRS